MSRRRALVTGAAGRVGQAIAIELARSGFDLVVHHDRSSPAETLSACRAAGADATAVQADLAHVAGCDAVVAAVLARGGTLDLLVNNASTFVAKPFGDITAEEWDRTQAINVRAPFLLVAGLLPALRIARGLVVNLCDIGGDRPAAGYAHYSVSKAGLIMLVKAIAVELGPEVRAIGISPGQVAWPETYDPALRAKIANRIPLKQAGTPEDVARLVRFAALEGTYLDGVIIPLDGGLASRY